MLKQRIITGLLLLFFLGGGALLLPAQGFTVMLLAVIAIAAWEWANLAGLMTTVTRYAYVLVTVLAMVGLLWLTALYEPVAIAQPSLKKILGVAGVWWALALLWVQSYPASAGLWGSRPMRLLMGWLVLLPTFLAFIYLRQQAAGIALVFYLVAVVACADIGAYFAGRAFGKRKLAPRVSPGKSWAGVVGGLIAAAVFVGVIAVLAPAYESWPTLSVAQLFAISILASLSSVLGDLLESMLKRERGIKDSSNLLPGHGGVLDRLDGITAAAPIFALCLLLVAPSQ